MNTGIYGELKKRILFFDYEPGQMLNEKAIAAEFGVSRTPVREVLLRLEWERLVTIIPRAGIMVSKVEFQQLGEVFQTRAPLEGLLARLATLQITDDHIAQLEETRELCRQILTDKSQKALLEVDIRFRNIIHQAADNESLREVSDYLYYQTQRLWHLIFYKTNFDLLVEEELEYMDRTTELFKIGDADEARKYREEVIYMALNRLRNIFEYGPDSFAVREQRVISQKN